MCLDLDSRIYRYFGLVIVRTGNNTSRDVVSSRSSLALSLSSLSNCWCSNFMVFAAIAFYYIGSDTSGS